MRRSDSPRCAGEGLRGGAQHAAAAPDDEVAATAAANRVDAVAVPSCVQNRVSNRVDNFDLFVRTHGGLTMQIAAQAHHHQLGTTEVVAQAQVDGDFAVVDVKA
jgi:hypothetical protein